MILIFHKIHRQQDSTVLAVCDNEVCGKTLGKGNISITVSERFYKEKEVSEAEVRKLLHRFDNINLVGNKAVQIAIEENLVSKEGVIEVNGVKHAQVFRV